MPTCSACHNAHIKCDQKNPCSRCVRLSIDCIEHISNQGKGNKKRRRPQETDSAAMLSQRAITDTKGMVRSEHFGLSALVRSWFATAVRRRSFGLLAKAALTAKKAGIPMNDMFNEGAEDNGMAFFPSLILQSSPSVCGPRLKWSELPESLVRAAGAVSTKNSSSSESGSAKAEDMSHLGSRWILIREINCGLSRYFTSPAFERDIVPWETIDQTFKANKQEVKSLLMVPSSETKSNYVDYLSHQISIHSKPNMPIRASKFQAAVRLSPTAMPGLKVTRTDATGGERGTPLSIQQAEVVGCIVPRSPNIMLVYTEFLLQEDGSGASGATSAANLSQDTMQQPDGGEWVRPPLDLGTDVPNGDDLDSLMELLNGDSLEDLLSPQNGISEAQADTQSDLLLV